MVSLEASLLLSAIAVVLSVVSIRRQKIPSRYEAERQIREKFEDLNPLLKFSDEDHSIGYKLESVSIDLYGGLLNRVRELISGDLCAETRLILRTDDGPITKLEKDIVEELKSIEKIRDADVMTGDGIPAIVIKLQIGTTDPDEVSDITGQVMYDEMPKYIRTRGPARLE